MSQKFKSVMPTKAIYLVIFVLIFANSIYPITLPLGIVQWTKDFYNVIDQGCVVDFATPARTFEGVKDGTRVFILFSGEVPKLWGDMSEAVKVVYTDLMRRGANILIFASGAANDATMNQYLLPQFYGTEPNKHPLYGTKFVNLGYVAGGNTLLMQWADSIRAITPKDAYGNNLADLPMMDNFDALKNDADLMIGLDARGLETLYVVRFNTVVLEMGGTDTAAYLAQSYTAGFYKGMCMGQRGGAEYEILSGIKGTAMAFASNAA